MTKTNRSMTPGSKWLSLATLLVLSATMAKVSSAQAVNAVPAPTIAPVAGMAGVAGLPAAGDLNLPQGVAYGPMGNLYIADTGNNTIDRVDVNTGAVTVVVGTPGVAETAGGTGDGGLATAALLSKPYAITFDAAGDYFISDYGFCSIREVNTAGKISTIVGTYTGTTTATCAAATGVNFSTGLVATSSSITGALGLAADASGNVYFATGTRIFRVNVPANQLFVFACAGSNGKNITGDGGTATTATCATPTGLALDPTYSNLYFADNVNAVVRKIAITAGPAAGNISEVAGLFDNPTIPGGATSTTPTPNVGNTGDGGQATSALLNKPAGIYVDASSYLYIASSAANVIRQVNLNTGIINTFAGAPNTTSPTGTSGSSGAGGFAAAALLNSPLAVAGNPVGNKIAIADNKNDLARVATLNNIFPTTAVGASSAAQALGFVAASSGTATLIGVSSTSPDFTAGSPSGCPGSLAVDGLCTVSVTFTPKTPGARTGQLVLTDSTNATYTINLTGTGTGAALTFTPSSSIAFGNVPRGTTSTTMTLTATNTGNQSLTISSIVTTPNTFTVLTGQTTDCAAGTLAAGATCQVRATFTPTAGGAATGTITFTDNALNVSGATQVIQLSGNGVVTPAAVNVQSGNNQTAHPLGFFAPLVVKVVDAQGFAANGQTVTFTVVGTVATATFPNGTNTTMVVTGLDGTASSPALTAGGNDGTFTVTASVPTVVAPATFTEMIAGSVSPTLTLTIPNSAGATYGQTLTINAALNPATYNGHTVMGTITFFDNGIQIGTPQTVSGTGTASISYAPNAGANAFTATYTSSDTNFSSSSTANATNVSVAQLGITATTTSTSLMYGQTINPIPGTLTGVLTKDAGNVTVTFLPNSTARPLNVGTYPLVATLAGSAASNYSVTVTGSPTLTITAAGSTTTITGTPNPQYLGKSVAFTISVASTVSGGPAPAGTVTVTSGSLTLGTATLVNGMATVNNPNLPVGMDTVMAVYNPSTAMDNTTSSGTTSITILGPDFTVATPTPAITIPQGGRGYVTLTPTGNVIFSSTVTFSCPGVPATFSCLFAPNPVASGASTVLTIATSGATQAGVANPFHKSGETLAFLLLPGFLFFAGMSKRAKTGSRLRGAMYMIAFALLLGSVTALTGCGKSVTEPLSPIGTTTINVVATSGTISHTTPIAVTVTGPAFPY